MASNNVARFSIINVLLWVTMFNDSNIHEGDIAMQAPAIFAGQSQNGDHLQYPGPGNHPEFYQGRAKNLSIHGEDG
jgi:hypothetical protein